MRKTFKKMLMLIKSPELRILPGQLAYFLIISLIPFVAMIGAIAGIFNISTSNITVDLGKSVPDVVINVINSLINGKGMNFNIAMFFATAFVLASNGMHSMIITANEIYKIENKDIISRRIKAILMMILLMLLFLFLLIVPVFGGAILSFIKNYVSDSNAIDFFYKVFQVCKYPFTVVVLYFNIKLLYVISPDDTIKAETTTYGSIFTTIGWIVASSIYSVYVGTFNTYNIFYGSISSILVLLIWVYILSYIFVLGLIINASYYKTYIKNKEE